MAPRSSGKIETLAITLTILANNPYARQCKTGLIASRL